MLEHGVFGAILSRGGTARGGWKLRCLLVVLDSRLGYRRKLLVALEAAHSSSHKQGQQQIQGQ